MMLGRKCPLSRKLEPDRAAEFTRAVGGPGA